MVNVENPIFLVVIFVLVCSMGLVLVSSEEALPKSRNERAALARQIAHQEQWKELSVEVKSNGDRVYIVYDPGFGYKRVVRNDGNTINDCFAIK